MPDQDRSPGRPHYTKVYWAELIADTQHLTAAQFGAYVRLLAHAVMCSDDFCSIPDVTSIQARIAGVDYRNWRRISADVRCLFGDTVSGRCQQKRLMEDASAWAQHCEKQRLRRTGGPPERDRNATGTRPDEDHTRAREKLEARSQKESQKIEPTASANGHAKPDLRAEWIADLERFIWPRYPRRIGKPAARRAWVGVKPWDQATLDAVGHGLKRWLVYWQERETALEHIPHPATWINQRRWEDQPQ